MILTINAVVIMQGSGSSKTELNRYYDTFRSPMGMLYLVFSGNALAEIRFEKDTEKAPLVFRRGKAPATLIRQLNNYFKGNLRRFDQKIVFLQGTDFEKTVWLCLSEVPYGETRTYKWLADRIGRPNASRAVGQALGKNPMPIVIPCHRIIESDGSIGGYSSGADIKRRLLEMEYYAGQSSL